MNIREKIQPRRLISAFLLLLTSLILGACTNSIVVKSDFPTPLVPTSNFTLGLLYPDDFQQYIYTETSKDRGKWIIDVGQAHTQVLDTVFGKLFSKVQRVEQTNNSEVDLIFEPKITDFQYAEPRETKVNIYEIWIKYNFKVYDSQGELVADWITSAYGKTPTAFLKSKEAAMHEAVVVALRDLGANLALNFRQVPEIKVWLDQAGRRTHEST